jgi:hypothetical protein
MDDIRLGTRLIKGTVAAKQILTILTKVFTRWNFGDTIALNTQSVAGVNAAVNHPILPIMVKLIGDIASNIVDAAVNLCGEVIGLGVVKSLGIIFTKASAQNGSEVITHSICKALNDRLTECRKLVNEIDNYIVLSLHFFSNAP